MSKLEQAYVAGFIKAAMAPQFFEGAQKPGIQNPLWSLMLPGYIPAAQPGTASSIYDRMISKQQDLDKLDIAKHTIGNTPMFHNLGFNSNSPLATPLASYMSRPHNPISNMLSPILGGDPVQANLGTHTGLQGFQAAGLGHL